MQLVKRSGLFWSKLVATHGRVKVVICEMVSSNQKFQMSGSLALDLCMKDWRMTTNKWSNKNLKSQSHRRHQKFHECHLSGVHLLHDLLLRQCPVWDGRSKQTNLQLIQNLQFIDIEARKFSETVDEPMWLLPPICQKLPCGIMSKFETQAMGCTKKALSGLKPVAASVVFVLLLPVRWSCFKSIRCKDDGCHQRGFHRTRHLKSQPGGLNADSMFSWAPTKRCRKKNSYPTILPVKGKSVNLFGFKPFERFPIFLRF